ncbi:unnamed protein product [Moneuplotes crassus]|uniref:Uncharacterized protein n=1 Tax=Euplotes crassus TaxID=5936 RepID=A0AAD1XJ73_EUPCR|nr:unnamed protein product [Moneuplotes crassus]
MSNSSFGTSLEIITNIGQNLLFVSEVKEGGYELSSYVKSYDVEEKDKLDVKHFDEAITKISLATQEKNWFAIAKKDVVQLYKVIPETGKLTMMTEFQADFDSENPHVNTVEFLYENKQVITGGNDTILRVWSLNIDKKKDLVTDVKEFKKYKSHTTPIAHIDVTFDHELVASIGSGDDKQCLIHDFATGNLLNELTFSEKTGQPNMSFQGCIFSPSRRYLYTLASEAGKKSYVTRWDAKSEDFKNLNTIKVADNYCPHFTMSSDGFYLAIGSETGFIKSLNTRYMQIDRDDQIHPGKMECVEFSNDTRFVLTCDKEGTYCFVPNMRAPGLMRAFFQYLMLAFFAYFIYRSIMESFFE